MDVTSLLRRTAQARSGDIATVFGDREKTWGELLERVRCLAGSFRGFGLQDGGRIASVMQNSDRYIEMLFASAWAGGTNVPLNLRWTVDDLADAITDSDSRILIVDDANSDVGLEISARCSPGLCLIYAGDRDCPPGFVSYEELVRANSPHANVERRGEDVFAIFYTGGTTGRSKGVMLSHTNVLASTMSSVAERMFSGDTVYLNAMPTFHLSSAWPILASVMVGAKSIVQSSVNPEAILTAIAREKVTEMLLVPTAIQMVIEHPDFREFDTSSLRRMIYGASPITEALLERAIVAFPKTEFIQVYGMTELSPLATVLHYPHHIGEGRQKGRHRSAGRPIYGVEIEIVDDNGQPVPRRTVGEIAVKGDNVMLGYWNRPDETVDVLRNGWIHSGDGGYMDEDGFVYVADRIKDMIISGAENIYSAEVENVLSLHESVQQCAVIGIPHEKWGEQVHAIVIPHAGKSIDAEEIIDFCCARMARFKCPKSVEIRTEPLPLSPVGKVLKHELRRRYREATADNTLASA